MNILKKIEDLSTTLKNVLFPMKCDLCGNFVDTRGLCTRCWSKISWISDPKCKICGTPFDIDISPLCAQCLNKKPYFDRAISVFEYNESSRDIIVKFKHFDDTHLVKQLATWVYRAAEREINKADMIIPVPIHLLKRLRRKYNQSELLAKAISNISGVEYEPRILRKIKQTRQQEGLSGKVRRKNVVGSFGVDENYAKLLENKNIILVDDVFTTGATVNECSKIIKKYKAKSVIVATVAMVVVR